MKPTFEVRLAAIFFARRRRRKRAGGALLVHLFARDQGSLRFIQL